MIKTGTYLHQTWMQTAKNAYSAHVSPKTKTSLFSIGTNSNQSCRGTKSNVNVSCFTSKWQSLRPAFELEECLHVWIIHSLSVYSTIHCLQQLVFELLFQNLHITIQNTCNTQSTTFTYRSCKQLSHTDHVNNFHLLIT